MADTVSDFLVDRLREWGIHYVFGYPGDGINGITAALRKAKDDPQFIQFRHEEMAAFAACAHSKFTGQVSVCLATSGPGAIHLLNGLYDAKLDHAPVVAIVGQQPRTALGGHYQQEVDLQSLFKDVAAEYVHTCMHPAQMPALIDRALRIALTERTVTCVIMPADVQEAPAVRDTPHKFKFNPSSLGVVKPRVVPPDEMVRRAADIINEGKKVAMLIGQGARQAADEVVQLAEKTGAGIAKALLGKDVLPDDLPFVTGSIGLLGTYPSWEMMQECDTFLQIGSNLPYSQFLPEWDQARGIQIDINPKMIGIRYPMELNLVGDARETLRMLLPLVHHKEDRSWRQKIEKSMQNWWKVVESRAMMDGNPINPQRVFWELSAHLPDECIITADCGSSTNWYARDVKIRKGMRSSLSGTLATMGPAMPYSIGAKFAHPDRPVLVIEGDGAMQMNGMAELLTVKKYYKQWSNQTYVVCVLHNNDLNQVTWEQRVLAGDIKFEASQELPDMDFAGYANLIGLRGIKVDAPDQIDSAWREAFAAGTPVVLDFHTDPEIPPLPPHITFEQAKGLSSALLKGDPSFGQIIKNAFKGKMAEYIHQGVT